MQTHRCLAGCGKTITWQFAICTSCEQKYGSGPKVWPEWLRFLWRDTQRERRQNQRQNRYEVNTDLQELGSDIKTGFYQTTQ